MIASAAVQNAGITILRLWWDYDETEGQQALWGNNVRLSSAFVQSVLTAKIPTDMRALKLLSEKGGPLAMDIYMWLSYRLFVARRPTLVPWGGAPSPVRQPDGQQNVNSSNRLRLNLF